MSVKIGSLFAGIGGFELGLERSIKDSETIWQVEQDPFCQRILKKHWPNAKIYNDVRTVGAHNLAPIDLLCGGFPCQDISLAGKQRGIYGKKSGLWFEMLRLINELRPRVVVMENVAAITFHGGAEVIASLAAIGYDAEWLVISARNFGAPHLRKRWFCVAYPYGIRPGKTQHGRLASQISLQSEVFERRQKNEFTNPDSSHCKRNKPAEGPQAKRFMDYFEASSFWRSGYSGPKILRVAYGVSSRMDRNRLKALGNAIVPQCSEFIGKYINESGILNNPQPTNTGNQNEHR